MSSQQLANEPPSSNVLFQEILNAFENEDYEKMAVSAQAYLEENKDETCKLTIALAKYFKLFGEGYAIWQGSYKYNLVRELFYCAQCVLNACPNADKNDATLKEAFQHLTNMLIAYTHCENSCICNDGDALEHYSSICEKEEEAGIEITKTLQKDRLTQLLLSYLTRNYHYHSGLRIFSETFRKFLMKEISAKEIELALTAIGQKLDQLYDEGCPELASELRSHRENLKRLKDLKVPKEPIRLPDTEVKWMMTAYVGDSLARKLESNDAEIKEHFETSLKKEWFTNLEMAPLEVGDIFDTSLGRENTKGLMFSLPRAYVVASGNIYPVEVEVKISVLGVCSVVMKTNLDQVIRREDQKEIPGLTLMHVRTLQSMVTPHAGNFLTLWIKENGEPFDEETVGKITKRPRFLHPYEFLTKTVAILNEFANQPNQTDNLKDLSIKVQQTQEKLAELAEAQVKRPVLQRDDKIQAIRKEVKEYRREIKELLQKSTQSFEPTKFTPAIKEKAQDVSDEISIQENSYYNLHKLIERILDHDLKKALTVENAARKHEITWVFEPHRNWYTYLYCREIYLGQKLAYADDFLNSELKALLVELREARPSLETDFLLGTECGDFTEHKNLGPIRSHKHDVLYMMENQALMYFPDDPQYITDQYARTIELVWWIRSLVLAFNKMVGKQIKKEQQGFDQSKLWSDKTRQGMEETVAGLDRRIHRLENFRAKALNTIQLFESLSVSKYQDHAELMREMFKSSNIQQLKANLEQGIENILRLQRHLNDRTVIKLAEIEREREKAQANRMSIFTVVLAIASISFPFQIWYEVSKSIWVVVLYLAIIPTAFLILYANGKRKVKRKPKKPLDAKIL